eukprot:162294-Alexandrium_andersonii.AAC.1
MAAYDEVKYRNPLALSDMNVDAPQSELFPQLKKIMRTAKPPVAWTCAHKESAKRDTIKKQEVTAVEASPDLGDWSVP